MKVVYPKIDLRPEFPISGSPEALQLLKVINNKLTLNEDVLRMLGNKLIAKKKICIISVAGAMRQGKSFLLNFFLHFFNKMLEGKNPNNWLDPKETLFPGFSWKTRSEKVTEGILIWPEVFLTKIDNEEIAILLMDTQGTYDNALNMTECTSFFALSVLLSSLQIYNVRNNLTLNYLQDLQLFTGYAGYYHREDGTDEKPFQNLLILVRDWCYSQDHEFGATGGKKLLENIFAKHANSKQKELVEIQSTIRDNYQNVDCFLLPYPGENVTTNRTFQGRFEDISTNFIRYVQELVAMLLAPQHLVLKKMSGHYVTAGDLPTLIRANFELFSSGTQLNVSTIYSANAEAYCEMLMEKYKQKFHELMRGCTTKRRAIEIITGIVTEFMVKKKMGGQNLCIQMKNRLQTELCEIYVSTYRSRFESGCQIL